MDDTGAIYKYNQIMLKNLNKYYLLVDTLSSLSTLLIVNVFIDYSSINLLCCIEILQLVGIFF